MDLGIADRRAAVAAGTAGLGLALAESLAEAGVQVAVCGRDTQRLSAAVDSISAVASGSLPVGITADVSTPEGAAAFVTAASEALGAPVEILVCNGGGPPPGRASDTDIEAYRSALESNCLASIAMCAAVVPSMREAQWGRIVGITSIGARQPIGLLAASTVARAALTAYLKMLAVELAPDGITVNNLQPGLHDTDRIKGLAGDQAEALLGSIPTGEFGRASDFGAVGAFLCSEQARFTTGVGMHIDGGAYQGLQ